LRTAVPAIAGVTAFITILLAFILYAGEKVAFHWSPGMIIGIAAVLRLLFLFRPPELSDDIYRYLWDGLRTLSGHNPYSMAPSQVRTYNEIYIHLLKHINHPDLITIYPPAAQIIFAIGAFFGGTVLGIKALLLTIDLATCCILLRLLSLLNLPRWRSVLYAWHPLPVIEIASSGHIDGAGIFFSLLLLLLLLRRPQEGRSASPAGEKSRFLSKKAVSALLAGLSFAAALLVKVFPLIFLPGLLIVIKKHIRIMFLIGTLFGMAVLVFPFLPEMRNSFVTLNSYLQNWEFSGFAFHLIRNLTSSGRTARILLAFVFLFAIFFFYRKLLPEKKPGAGDKACRGPRYSLNQPRAHTDPDTFLSLVKTYYFITLSFLLLTTTLYPWYVLYLACLLPFAACPAGIVLSWAVFLSYRVLIPYTLLGVWNEDERTSAMITAAPVLAFILAALAKKISKIKSSRIPVS
jgi:hypothetical protein